MQFLSIFILFGLISYISSQLNPIEIINSKATIFRNLNYEELRQHEIDNNEGTFIWNGTFAVDTGKFTGRSPNDKWIVMQSPSSENIWWGNVNRPISPEVFDHLYDLSLNHYQKVDKAYIFDGYTGANPRSQRKVRFITELAWQSHFVTNMFIRPDVSTLPSIDDFEPDFTVINACKVTNDKWKEQGLNSEVFIAFNIEKKVAVIGGTWYGGEMKKGIFSMMNYWLPLEGTMTMHCSANKGKNGDTALFFGLSGTGKTTLSADPHRALIGDDEHGWDTDGIFNLEGGCYAKTINLSEKNEPEIYRAIRPGAMLENVAIDPETKIPDFYDTKKTENSRVSYPLEFIPNFDPTSTGGHPKNIIFLTCDAFGVLPPVSKLTIEQAMYHFISGYTAKVAGTERGITEPQATFSACFGAAFLPLHPSKYADLLRIKLQEHGTNIYLVNTGWTGGGYGQGKRMNIQDTRACVDAILDGTLDSLLATTTTTTTMTTIIQNQTESLFEIDPIFGFLVPKQLGSISPSVLNPRLAWSDPKAYDQQRLKLATLFINNYKKFITLGQSDYSSYGPQLAAPLISLSTTQDSQEEL